ncbi:MAG: alpha/beta hydrolase [Polyangiaceae bacterium]|nr:alpha/beta hydrolase [Polyangiaceae bacterium]
MKSVHTNGIEITYDERGTGEPLVLAAGIGMQLVSWPDGFLDKLAARGLRVIVFDHRDIGKSTKFQSAGIPNVKRLLARAVLGLPVTAPYTLYDMAGDVAGLITGLGLEKAHLCGVSMGGMVAQATAIRHGHRLTSLISMMSHPLAGLLTVAKPHAAMKLLAPAPKNRDQAIFRQVDFFRTVGSPGFERDDSLVALSAGRAYDRSFHPPGFARHFAAILATGDMRPGLRNVRLPTLVMHGDQDPVIRSTHGEKTAKSIPQAQWRLIKGWGHDLPVGAWDLLSDAIAEHVFRAARR